MAEFESLDAASRARFGDDVFAFVAILFLRCREALAFNRKERVKLAVPTALNDECGTARFWREVNFSAAMGFIAGFSSELDVTPIGRVIRSTVEMVAEVFSQFGFRVLVWPFGVVAPARKFLSDEVHEFQLRRES